MAIRITDECVSCGACEDQCPNDAISMGPDIFEIDPALCTECVGFNGGPACADACPVDCCLPDPEHVEAEDELLARARRLHPGGRVTMIELSPETSHFRS
jgi:ferredoxin